MSSYSLIKSNSSILPTYESNQAQQSHCHNNNNTRTRSSSSASDDPTKKRMTHLTTRLKNAFRISHQPTPSSSSSSPSPSSLPSHSTDSIFPSSAPMKVRSFSLPSSSHHHPHQNYYFPSSDQVMTKSRPLSCVIEQSTDGNWVQEDPVPTTTTTTTTTSDAFPAVSHGENNVITEQTQQHHYHHHPTDIELDHHYQQSSAFGFETPTSVPGLIVDSACSSTVSEVDSLHSVTTTTTTTNNTPMEIDNPKQEEDEDDDTFVYEQQTEWINTGKHWYSDYKFPFHSKSAQAQQDPPPPIIQRPPKQPHEGILKRPNTPSSIITTAAATTTVLGKRPMPTSATPHVNMQHDTNAPTSLTLARLPSVLGGGSSSNSGGGGPFHKKKKRTPVIRFDKMVQVHATYSQQDYNRQSDPDAICTRLNATLAHQIKQELNLYKTTEMSIHEQSKAYTQLFC